MIDRIPHIFRFHCRANIEGWAAAAAVAATAVSAGAEAYSSSQQASGQQALANAMSKKPKIVPANFENPSVAYGEYNSLVNQEYPQMEADANMFNTTDNSNYQNMLGKTSPGLISGIGTQGQDADSLLSGKIPSDVAGDVTRSAAYQALSGGYGATSGAKDALTARDLGMTSLNLENQGSSMLASNLANDKAVNPYDMTGDSLLLTPQQELSRDDSNAAYANGVLNANNNIQYQNSLYATAANSYNPAGAGALSGLGALGGASGQRSVSTLGSGLSSYFGGGSGAGGSYTTPGSNSYDAASAAATSGGVYNPYLDTNNYDDSGSFIGNAASYGGG